jgi:hypothetical protein
MDNQSTIKVILTGATGMVGEGVLNECLLNNAVSQVLIINRKLSGFEHEKLKEIIHRDFNDFSSISDQLSDYDACFFCLGVSSVGIREPQYYALTFSLTMHVAQTLSKQNSSMIFCYVSGAGTDTTEKGRLMWARVKGKTENELMKLPFKKAYNFRPGVLQAAKGAKNVLSYYKYFSWLIPFVKLIAPNAICSLQDLGKAMIYVSTKGYEKQILEVKDIHALAK